MKTKDGNWRLSPSALHKYAECPSCFWVDNHYKKAPMYPLLLNSAMDSILKYRYDQYRQTDAFPPEVHDELMVAGVVPFKDLATLEQWRTSTSALRMVNAGVGYELVGKIDDVLVETDGRLVPADYKSSGNAPKEDKYKFYLEQLTAYGLMFRAHGHEVGDRAFLLHYYVKDKTNPSLSVEFESHVDHVPIDIDGLERKLVDMVALLNGDYPGHNPECSTCAYHDGRDGVLNGD